MNKVLSALCLLAMLSALPACAAEKTPVSCADAVTTVDMVECQKRINDSLSAEADALFAKRKAIAQKQDKDASKPDEAQNEAHLLESQAAFDVYMQKECAREAYMYYGGTMAPLISGGCREGLIKQRIEDLKVWPEPED